jgi:hypothetical protein
MLHLVNALDKLEEYNLIHGSFQKLRSMKRESTPDWQRY